MLAFTMLVFNTSFGSAIPDDDKDIANIVDVDVGIEAVAVATLNFTSKISVTSNSPAIITEVQKNIFLENPNDKDLWKFENIPLTNLNKRDIKLAFTDRYKLYNSSGGISAPSQLSTK